MGLIFFSGVSLLIVGIIAAIIEHITYKSRESFFQEELKTWKKLKK